MLKKRILTASEAILEATDQIMKKDKNLIIIGEGVNDPKGIFGTTINLYEKYGKVRIIESPISLFSPVMGTNNPILIFSWALTAGKNRKWELKKIK